MAVLNFFILISMAVLKFILCFILRRVQGMLAYSEEDGVLQLELLKK